ncbi:MAG: adenylate/guanylate cyclase domain-containing protein [Deltaproteobacteria bacterium]|nr:adenylate/guanylate cyclase domain-containing protein [Deltaproteobacteria bacterium]
MKKHVPLVLSLALGLLAAVYTYLEPIKNLESSPLLGFEQKLLDLKFRWRGRVDVDPQVVIAAGDEKTIRAFGRWGTWDRRNYATIIDNLRAAGAEVVAFDMVFADPVGIDHANTVKIGAMLDDAQLAATAGQLAVAASEGTPAGPAELAQVALAAKAIEDRFQHATDGDARLAAAFEEHSSNVVQGAVINIVAEDGRPRSVADHAADLERLDTFLLREYGFGWKLTELADPNAGAEAKVASLDVHKGGKPSDLRAVEATGELVLPQPGFLDVASNVGFFSAYVDPDGVLRRQPVVFRVGETFLPALSMSAAAAYFGANPLLFADGFYKSGFARVGFPGDGGAIVEVPVDLIGRLLVNYYGPGGPNDPGLPDEQRGVFPRVPLSDVFCADLPPVGQPLSEAQKDREAQCGERAVDLATLRKLVEKKVVLVAVTAIGTFDQRVTPFSPNVPGTEVHAAAVQNMIDGKALKRPALHVQAEMLLCLVVALLFGLLLPRLPVAAGVVFLAASLGAWWFVDWNILFAQGRWFYDVPLLLQMSTTWAGITAWGYLTTGREKARLKEEFSTVLAPTVVDQLLVNPALAGLGGAERELTVMFSDIRGFTTMSEKLSPEGLTQFLNEYLTPMTDILIRHEGTLDKYMGDAIMAFWGAPLEQKDHAKRACVTAVEMLEKLDELKAKWRAEGKPEIDIGIGLNSGLMRVGFMGSARMRNYTLLGDNVNLGSRLEGTNKNYGTHIIVSGEAIHGRWLDAVRVKGKKEPVNIYEVSGKGPLPPSMAVVVQSFEDGLRLYQAQQWDAAETKFKAAIAARGGSDPPSDLYLERIDHFRHEPPPANWDGVYEFKTK